MAGAGESLKECFSNYNNLSKKRMALKMTVNVLVIVDGYLSIVDNEPMDSHCVAVGS